MGTHEEAHQLRSAVQPASPDRRGSTSLSDSVPVEALGAATYPVAGSTATVAVKWEAELVARYQAYLEARGSSCVRYKLRPPGELRDRYTDLLDQTENVLYEAKGVATREAIRMALGQLLDYSRHVPTAPTLAVLLPAMPATDLLNLLAMQGIRCRTVHRVRVGALRLVPDRRATGRGVELTPDN